MAEVLMDLKQSSILSATIISNERREPRYPLIRANSGTHPLLSEENIQASQLIIEQMCSLKESEYFLFLLSGGASALFEILNPKINLESYRNLVDTLMREAIDISELNCIRIVLSLVKGGRAAQQIRASGSVLLVSDVLNDNPELIASGPFYFPDKERLTKSRAAVLYYRWKLQRWIAWETFWDMAGSLAVFHKKGRKIPHRVVANNKLAIKAAAKKAAELGFKVKSYPRMLYGEAREAARIIEHQIAENEKNLATRDKVCLIWGGETTVTVRGNGIGGRNQELLLSLIAILADNFSWQAASFGTDGIDGVSDAAGAWFSNQDFTNFKISQKEIFGYLKRNDSASFFKKYQRQILSGPTGTNVGDLLIVLINVDDF